MSVPFVPAHNIEEVIHRLDEIIQHSIDKKSALGFFPALYVVVTEKIKEGIDKGNVFEDNDRMERLDVIFANRYLEAFHLYRNGGKPTRPWQYAFEITTRFSFSIILQELLAGMNAHINFDLGIATAQVAPGDQLPGLHNDFMTINQILGSLTGEIQQEINLLSPRIGLIDRWLKSADDAIINFSLRKARDEAWEFAQDLAKRPEDEWEEELSDKIEDISELSEKLIRPGFLPSLLIWWIKRKESKDVPAIIEGIRTAAKGVSARM